MKKITKKEIKKYVREVINNNLNWKVDRCGFYIKNNLIEFFISYKGQGVDENIYNNTYEEIAYIEEVIEEYKRREYNLKDIDTIVYENVNDMINRYNKKIEENKICINEFISQLKGLIGEEFSILEFDNKVQEIYVSEVGKTSCWDYFTDGEVEEYLNCENYTYAGLGKDYDININVIFKVVKRNKEENCLSIIKIKNIELL